MRPISAATITTSAEGLDVGDVRILGWPEGASSGCTPRTRSAASKAGVAWYGRLVGDKDALHPRHPIDVAAALKAPVLGLYGGQDQGIPVATVEEMRKALATGGAASKRSQIQVYPDAGHAFFADYRPSYRAADAADGWNRMPAWFKANGVAPLTGRPHVERGQPQMSERAAAAARLSSTASAASNRPPAVSADGITQQRRPAALAARRPRSESSITRQRSPASAEPLDRAQVRDPAPASRARSRPA